MAARTEDYGTLGLGPTATLDEVGRAWRSQVRALHPDRAEGAEEAARRTRALAEVNAAYDRIVADLRARAAAAAAETGSGDRKGASPEAEDPRMAEARARRREAWRQERSATEKTAQAEAKARAAGQAAAEAAAPGAPDKRRRAEDLYRATSAQPRERAAAKDEARAEPAETVFRAEVRTQMIDALRAHIGAEGRAQRLGFVAFDRVAGVHVPRAVTGRARHFTFAFDTWPSLGTNLIALPRMALRPAEGKGRRVVLLAPAVLDWRLERWHGGALDARSLPEAETAIDLPAEVAVELVFGQDRTDSLRREVLGGLGLRRALAPLWLDVVLDQEIAPRRAGKDDRDANGAGEAGPRRAWPRFGRRARNASPTP